MKNNKHKFSPLAALGSGTICLTVFGGTFAPMIGGVLFTSRPPVFEPVGEGTTYSATYVELAPPKPPASPEPEPVDEPVDEVETEEAAPEPEPELVDVSEPSLNQPIVEDLAPAPEQAEMPPTPENVEPPEIDEPEPETVPEVTEELPVTDIAEAATEIEVEDPGCPGDSRVETLGDETWYVHREMVEYYAARPFQIKEIAGTWRVRNEQGDAIGFKVRPTECSVLFQAGFESNDIVTSINGRTVTSMVEGIQAYFALRRDSVFEVKILRDGEEAVLAFFLEETEKDKARLARQQQRQLRQAERDETREARVQARENRREERRLRRMSRRGKGDAVVQAER